MPYKTPSKHLRKLRLSKALRESLIQLKVQRSRASRNADLLQPKSATQYEAFADAAFVLYEVLDELDIEELEKILIN
jgi:hypothetical protein